MKSLMVAAVAMTAVVLTGCVTERTRVLAEGESEEATAGFSEDNLRYVVSKAVQGISKASKRYASDDGRRVVTVRPFGIDTNARGSQAGYLAESLQVMFEEALTGWDGDDGKFIVYNENVAVQTGSAPITPEFILTGRLREQNVRRDNGNYYKETFLQIRLTDVATKLDFWQKRVPLTKAVDKTNLMN